MALLASIIATLLLTALGMALVLVASAGSALTLNDRLASATDRAAEAALRLAASEMRERVDWRTSVEPGLVADVCGEPGRFVDASLFPRQPWDGVTLDLHLATQQLQDAATSAAPAGTSAPVWRLFEYGPIFRLVPSDSGHHPYYVAVWTADGGGGPVLLHAMAIGPAGARASVEGTLGRSPAGAAVLLAVRSVP
jgi:hypothetical protein